MQKTGIRKFLKRYKLLRQFVQKYFRAVNFASLAFHYILSFIYLPLFFKKHKINKEQYILFAHGSLSDTFYMASLLPNFALTYGRYHVIAAQQHKDIFKMYPGNQIAFIWLTEKSCQRLRKVIISRPLHDGEFIKKGIIRPLHGVLYKNLLQLVLTERLYYRSMITGIMGIDKDAAFNYVSYSAEQKTKAKSILQQFSNNISKIALINPICYTHQPLSISSWRGIARSLAEKGYVPVFNVKANFSDVNSYDIPNEYPAVEIPAYLVPICAEFIGLGCARNGGGFDLLYAYNKNPTKCLLVTLEEKVEISFGRNPEPSFNNLENFYENFSGKKLTYKIALASYDDEKEAYLKTGSAVEPLLSSKNANSVL